jgi:hypothetical protein
VSLILDALRKLEREKPSAEQGVLVVGAIPWQGARRRTLSFLALAAGALLVLAVALGAWWLGRTHRGAPAAAAGGAPAPAPPSVATAVRLPGAALPASRPLVAASASAAPPARRLTLPEPAAHAAPAATTLPPAAPPSRGPQLNAISQQEGKPVAVIDGRLVHEGDSVDGVRVLRIGETEVEVEVHGQRRTLRF